MIAILIHVHRDPEQVKNLVERLLHPDVDIYINVDAKTKRSDFESLVSDNASFINKSIEVTWGRFSQVEQMLNSFQEIRESGKKYSHIVFISGQDYPIKPINELVDFLKQHEDKSFIDYHLVSKNKDDDWRKVIHRRFEYWYFLAPNDIRSKELVRKFLKLIGFKRKYPTADIYYGACWFTLTSEALNYLLDYIEEHPAVLHFFRHTGCADELFFQSLLLNSPLKETMIAKHYRYIDWEKGGKNPKDLTVADFDKIKQSDAWFARKINPQTASVLVDMLDDLVQQRQK